MNGKMTRCLKIIKKRSFIPKNIIQLYEGANNSEIIWVCRRYNQAAYHQSRGDSPGCPQLPRLTEWAALFSVPFSKFRKTSIDTFGQHCLYPVQVQWSNIENWSLYLTTQVTHIKLCLKQSKLYIKNRIRFGRFGPKTLKTWKLPPAKVFTLKTPSSKSTRRSDVVKMTLLQDVDQLGGTMSLTLFWCHVL